MTRIVHPVYVVRFARLLGVLALFFGVIGVPTTYAAPPTQTATNQPPQAQDDTYTTPKDTPLRIAAPGVRQNDSDPDGNSFYALTVSDPSRGSLLLNRDGSFTYTPTAGYAGRDSFRYKVNDGRSDSNIATVYLMIMPNQAPVAQNDSYTTPEDEPMIGYPLANDTDAENDALTLTILDGAINGLLFLNDDGSFSYTPNQNFNGTVQLTYKANDGQADSNVATITITVTPVDDAPIAQGDTYTTQANTALTVGAPGVLGNDYDADGHALTAVLVTGPTKGTVTLNANGSFRYIPAANVTGTDRFSYKIIDGTAESFPTTVVIDVTPAKAPPTITVAPGGACLADFKANIPLTLADSDTPLAALTLGATTTNAALVPLGNITFAGTNGNRTVTITPVAGRSGVALITLTVRDGALSATTTIRVLAGTATNDTLSATTGAHLVFGGGGNDTLSAPNARSVLCGGAGDDRLTGGVELETLDGGDGTDVLVGGAQRDLLYGGAGNDQLTGGDGNDVLAGGAGVDVLDAGAGVDVLDGGTDDDQLRGGDGNDRLFGGDGNDTLTGGVGADRFDGGAGTDTATDVNAAQGDTQTNIP